MRLAARVSQEKLRNTSPMLLYVTYDLRIHVLYSFNGSNLYKVQLVTSKLPSNNGITMHSCSLAQGQIIVQKSVSGACVN